MDLIFKCTLCFLIFVVITPCLFQKLDVFPDPTWIDLTQLDGSSAVLQWSFDLNRTEHVRIKAYNILYYPSDVPSQVKRMTMVSRNNGKQGVRFSNLSPNTRYVMKLRAVSVDGEGPWISRSLTIMPYVGPVITIKPTDQRKQEGSDVIFRLKTTGFPSPAIKWLFNDWPIQYNHSIDSFGSLIIKDVRRGKHDGRYTCVATNDVGSISTSATLFIDVKVSAHVPSREYTFTLTTKRANLSCYGRGFPLPNITWTKDGLPVSLNQTDRPINETFIESRLNLGSLKLDKTGRYFCHVGNDVHRQEPIIVAMDVFLHPVIDVKPTDQKVFEGPTVILPCDALGFPAPNITWLFNDDPIPWEHSIDNDSLVLKNVRHERHDGRYTCVATSKAGTVSISASLIIYVKLFAHALSREYIFSLTSQSAKLSCSGSGYPLPNVTWTKNGLPVSLNQTDSVINETFIESILSLGNLTIEKAGRYSFNVGNGVQEPISVAMEILIRPVINVAPTDQKVFERSTVILPCEASGFPAPNITWLFNDDPIPWEYSIENDSLLLNNARHGRHDGRYTCVATSKAGTVFTSTSLRVYDEPSSFAKKRRYVFSVIASDYVFVSCYGSGNPRPIIVWEKDGSPVSLNQTDIVLNDTVVESRLHLGNFTPEKAGKYYCYVKSQQLDGVYIPTPRKLAILAWFYPAIVEEPVDRETIEGATIVFECKSKGFPQPTTTWLFNGKPIPFEHTIEGDGSLVLENVRRNPHAGKYTCVATSEAGTAKHFAWLFIDGGCPSAWKTYRGSNSCYRIVDTRTAKWDDARRSCISMGGYLVKIDSEEENRYVTKLASEESSAEIMWIGLSRISEDDFRWTDGTRLSGRYSKWNKGEPNNAKGNEDCVHLYVRDSNAPYWNDHICNFSDGKPFYACEMERI